MRRRDVLFLDSVGNENAWCQLTHDDCFRSSRPARLSAFDSTSRALTRMHVSGRAINAMTLSRDSCGESNVAGSSPRPEAVARKHQPANVDVLSFALRLHTDPHSSDPIGDYDGNFRPISRRASLQRVSIACQSVTGCSSRYFRACCEASSATCVGCRSARNTMSPRRTTRESIVPNRRRRRLALLILR